MRARLVPVVSAVLLLAACGDEPGAITIGSSSPTAAFDKKLCDEFESNDGPSKKLLAALPADERAAAKVVVDIGKALDAMGDNDATTLDRLTSELTADGVADHLRKLGDFAEKQCGTSSGSIAISGLATASELATEPRDADYCEALRSTFEDPSSGEPGADPFAALSDVAPESHQAALKSLGELDAESISGEEAGKLTGPLFGLGLYAESTCGIDGAFAQMLLGAAFTDGGGSATPTSLPDGADPSQFPDITADAANAALPEGSGLEFAVSSADLEDDGRYLASVIVPTGWESESNFNVEFTPPADSGASIFTSVEVGAGCDGSCESTDWQQRLRGETGALTSYLQQHPDADESPISDSAGVIVTDLAAPAALVLRWDDSADRYFSCEVTLEEGQEALLPAFVAACVNSRPAWFAVG